MSYCRFSSDDFLCDVYVYADCGGGWTTHVAGNRFVYKSELPEKVSFDDIDAYLERERVMRKLRDEADRVDIDLPHAGGTFNDETAEECADTLLMLRDVGYIVPSDVIEALQEDYTISEGEE